MVGNAYTPEPYQVPDRINVSKWRAAAYLVGAFVLGAIIF